MVHMKDIKDKKEPFLIYLHRQYVTDYNLTFIQSDIKESFKLIHDYSIKRDFSVWI